MVVFAAVAAIDTTGDDEEDSVREAVGVVERLGDACTQCREVVDG